MDLKVFLHSFEREVHNISYNRRFTVMYGDTIERLELKPFIAERYMNEVKERGFEESFNNCKRANFCRINPEVRSKHVFIAVAGFLSEKHEKNEWAPVLEHF